MEEIRKFTSLYDVLNNFKGAVGVDIDDVIISLNEKIIYYANIEFRNKLKTPLRMEEYPWIVFEDIKQIKDVGITREDLSMLLKKMESDGTMENLTPRHHCISSLKTLAKIRDIYFGTSRRDGYYNDAEGMTERWLANVEKENKFRPKEVIFNHKKEEVAVKKGIGLFFEDNPMNALKLLEAGVAVVMFNAPWNYTNIRDSWLLPNNVYEQKKSVITNLNKYEGKCLFRVNDWSYVMRNLI
jgi:uncharacterized HAD superfamily protein